MSEIAKFPHVDMDDKLLTAAHASTALALALQGLNKIAVEDEQEQLALEWLADEARFAVYECQKILDGIRKDRAKVVTVPSIQ
jgi:hypothetical protein